jgi:hypothetical protein
MRAPTSSNPAATPHQIAKTSRSIAPSRLATFTVSGAGGPEPGRSVSVVGFNVVPPVFRQNGLTGGDEPVKIKLS